MNRTFMAYILSPKNSDRNYQHIKTRGGQPSPLERGVPMGRGVFPSIKRGAGVCYRLSKHLTTLKRRNIVPTSVWVSLSFSKNLPLKENVFFLLYIPFFIKKKVLTKVSENGSFVISPKVEIQSFQLLKHLLDTLLCLLPAGTSFIGMTTFYKEAYLLKDKSRVMFIRKNRDRTMNALHYLSLLQPEGFVAISL